ncbi:MAG TPA: ATP-binding protein [Methylomirabilota bacterium]|nr:ATP-binding protein [Methylomirabilota bacterium]
MTSIVGRNSDDAAVSAVPANRSRASASLATTAFAVLATAAGYYVGSWLALALRYPASVHSVFWPPNAIVLAALLLLPAKLWLPVLVAVFPAHVLTLASTGWPWSTVGALFLTNTSQALLGAALVRYVSRRYTSAQSFVIVFIASAVFVAPFAVSFADVGVMASAGLVEDYWSAWQERFLSNAASVIVFVPPILAAARVWRSWRRPALARCVEAMLFVACFAALGAVVLFAASVASNWLPLMLCTFLPLLLWAALRFGSGGVSCALLGLVAVAMGSIVRWAGAGGEQQEIMILQAFFLLVAIPLFYLATLHADLRQSLRALDATNQRYRIATAAGLVGVWEWNPQTDELILDRQLKEMLGYRDNEIADRLDAWMPHIHGEERERVMALAHACAAGQSAIFDDEHRMLHADGGLRWFLTRGRRALDADGAVARVLGTCIDVTERRRIADELRSLEVLWSAMLASLTEQVAIIDRDGAVVAVNDAWLRRAATGAGGRFPRVPVGANYLDACRSPDDSDAVRAVAGIRSVLDGSEDGFRMEYDDPGPGAVGWFEFSVIPLRRNEGGAVLSHRDITRRKQAEIAVEQQRQELTHLTRVGILGQLSGALAHELNQPLTAILSNAQAAQRLLAREPLDRDELEVALADIVEADKRADGVIRRLRDLLRKGKAQFRSLDLNEVVSDALELAHSDLVMREVMTTCRLTPDLPAVRGDRVQLQQIVLNLIANACEAMSETEPGRRVLTVATIRGADETVQIVVSDSGAGIDSDMQARLFEPFFTTKKQGLGLGLPICNSIATVHGGYMQASNSSAGGAEFIVTLPVEANTADLVWQS